MTPSAPSSVPTPASGPVSAGGGGARASAAALLCAGLALLLPPEPLPGQAPAPSTRAVVRSPAAAPPARLPGPRDGCDPGAAAHAWPFAPPSVSAVEPRTRLSPVRISRGERHRWVGLVDLGDRFPFWLRRPPCPPDGEAAAADRGPAVAASVAGGAFSRFDLESSQNDFIEVHYRVGIRLLARLGRLEARAELFHVSSHLGDEFLQRTGREPVSTSREGLEVLVGGRPLASLRVYGGPGLLLRSSRDFDPATLRAGAEWEPSARWGAFRPYLGIEALVREELAWSPTAAAEAGVLFGERYRLALTAGAGRSRAEQFFREDETLLGLTFSADF